MSMFQSFVLLLLFSFTACKRSEQNTSELNHVGTHECSSPMSSDSSMKVTYKIIKGALLSTRFNSLEELKTVVQIEYFNNNTATDSVIHKGCKVRLSHCSSGREVIGVLVAGVTQGDIYKALYSENVVDRFSLLFSSPYAIGKRKDLEKIYTISRWRPEWFGEGDLAFFDIAKASVENINTPDLA